MYALLTCTSDLCEQARSRLYPLYTNVML